MMLAPAPPIRVFLVDDHEMVLRGLAAMLSQLPQLVTVVGTTSTHHGAVEAVDDIDPDVVLCDVRLGSGSGLDLCAALLASNPSRKVVFLTVYDDEQYLF